MIPVWGTRKAREITRRDIIVLLNRVSESGPIAANHTLAVIRKMFNFAVDRAILESSPCLRVNDPEKRDALDRWARKLRSLLTTDNVIRLRA